MPSVRGTNSVILWRLSCISPASYWRRIAFPYSVRRGVKQTVSSKRLSFSTLVRQLVLPSSRSSAVCPLLSVSGLNLPRTATQRGPGIITLSSCQRPPTRKVLLFSSGRRGWKPKLLPFSCWRLRCPKSFRFRASLYWKLSGTSSSKISRMKMPRSSGCGMSVNTFVSKRFASSRVRILVQ